MSRFFTLPRVSVAALVEVRPDLAARYKGRWRTPRLEVLAMGWSWSLYLCHFVCTKVSLLAVRKLGVSAADDERL